MDIRVLDHLLVAGSDAASLAEKRGSYEPLLSHACAVLADGINLGLTRMAEACRATSWRQLTWTADWHVRDECYAQALAGLIDAQHRQPLSAHWGSGTTSSSDAQFFRAGGRGEVRGHVNLHYG